MQRRWRHLVSGRSVSPSISSTSAEQDTGTPYTWVSLAPSAVMITGQLALPTMFAAASVAVPNAAQADLKDNIIFSSCAAAMRKEYKQADKQLLLSQLNQTCNCVVEQINNQKNIEQAKNSCIDSNIPISSNQDRRTL